MKIKRMTQRIGENVFMLFLVVIVLSTCTQKSNDTSFNLPATNLELINGYVKSVETMDFEIMKHYLDDRYIGIGPSIGDSINKTQAIENWKTNVQTLYESISYKKSKSIAVTVDSGENEGEWVSNWAELEITYKDNKGTVTIMANTIYEINNRKIVKSYTFYNEADALKQLGYVFINPNNL